MARDEDGDAIEGAGSRHGARRVGVAELARELGVAARLAAGNLAESLPDAKLKDGATEIKRAGLGPACGEVGALAHAGERGIDPAGERAIAAQLGQGKLGAEGGLGFGAG